MGSIFCISKSLYIFPSSKEIIVSGHLHLSVICDIYVCVYIYNMKRYESPRNLFATTFGQFTEAD